jgi:hypothetical protein
MSQMDSELPDSPDFDSDLAAMAADPDIQREIAAIGAEFAGAETGGLTDNGSTMYRVDTDKVSQV